jgi:hypothetical protein
VIGVMASRFRHPYRTDIWVPFAEAIDFSQIGVRGYYAMSGTARRKDSTKARIRIRRI